MVYFLSMEDFMEITLEKIELVKDRTGATYKEAKEALEKADGNVVEAIIAIEDNIDTTSSSEKIGAKGELLISKMKEVIRKGNIARIVVKRNDEVVLNLPVNAGILGAIIAPWGIVIGVLAAFSFKCRVDMVKDNGDIVNISDKAGNICSGAVAKSAEIYGDIKDKAPGVYETIKDKAPEVYETIKEKSGDVTEKAKDIAKDASEVAIGVASRFKKKEEDLENCEKESEDCTIATEVIDEISDDDIEDTIKEKSQDAKEVVEDKVNEISDKVEDKADETKKSINEIIEDGEDKSEEIQEDVIVNLDEVKQVVEETLGINENDKNLEASEKEDKEKANRLKFF